MNRGFSFILAVLTLLFMGSWAQAQTATINGAGASFPYPVYSQWAHKYHELTGAKINYQSIGSGGGIAQIKAKTVDFGGTDEPLKPGDLEQLGLIQFPTVMGGVVPVYNVPGVRAGDLHLDGPTLAAIFLGKISKWDDPALKKLNPKLQLPAQAITVAHRTDGSGTTFIFTSYLAKVSPEWQQKVGAGKAVKWPAANSIGGKGNEGVAGQVKAVSGAMGYVEYAYAFQNRIPYAVLKNQAGKFVAPDLDTFQSAAANADWSKAPKGFSLMLIDQPGEKSWPIVGATYIMYYQDQPDAKKAKEILKFFAWSYKHGSDMAKNLHYVPIPDNVVKLVEANWKEVKSGGKPVWP
ncbi:MAG: phosphate ABC transporter substrate-binding protein PstS [Deltaproteobacteria bacterium RBG_13_60_28]|nr:MAG: phosphate ABC transporter substrate-binding protein PstS [Deltaproteobacteria bacterium RBG_13_60_28]